MVGIRIGIACRTRIEMAPRRGEVWFTLPDSVQMNTVLAGLYFFVELSGKIIYAKVELTETGEWTPYKIGQEIRF